MRNRGLSEVMVWVVMSLYDDAKTRVRLVFMYSDEFKVKVSVHHGSVLLPLLFAIVWMLLQKKQKVITEKPLLFAKRKIMEDLKERFRNWKDALGSKDLEVNIRKTKVMVGRSEGELFKSKIDSCGVCRRVIMVNSVLYTKCGNWVHSRYAKIKRVIVRLGTLCLLKM